MIVLPAGGAETAVGGDERAYRMFRSCGWPPRPTFRGSFLPCFPRDVSFCRSGRRVGHSHADRLQGSGFLVGVARHGQCQQSVADHGIRLAEYFGQLLAARNTDAPSNAETIIDRQAGKIADE
jgi:hypothetical protein